MPKVKFDNEEIEVAEGSDLKDVATDNGWPIAFGCGDGVCGTCIVKIIEGKDNLSQAEEKELQTLSVMGLDDGEHRLLCQCKIKGDVVIEGM